MIYCPILIIGRVPLPAAQIRYRRHPAALTARLLFPLHIYIWSKGISDALHVPEMYESVMPDGSRVCLSSAHDVASFSSVSAVSDMMT